TSGIGQPRGVRNCSRPRRRGSVWWRRVATGFTRVVDRSGAGPYPAEHGSASRSTIFHAFPPITAWPARCTFHRACPNSPTEEAEMRGRVLVWLVVSVVFVSAGASMAAPPGAGPGAAGDGPRLMRGEVTKISEAKGTLMLKTADGDLELQLPPSAV